MGYIKAENVLPPEVLELVQRYVDGQSIYIPRRISNHKSWGDNTSTRAELGDRNLRIYADYSRGVPVRELAQRYFLTEKSIRRILRRMRPVSGETGAQK